MKTKLIAIATAVVSAASSVQADRLVIKGSDTLGAKLVPQLAEEFKAKNADTTFDIAAEGSTTGISALIDGTAQIGMSSREVKPAEDAAAKSKGVKLQPTTVAHDGIAIIVNAGNPIAQLTKKQVEQIFTGEPGSPVIDRDGRVVALVSMRVPQGEWFNFATPLDTVADVLASAREGSPFPLERLTQSPRRALAQDPRFLDGFQTLAGGNALRATSQFLLLLKTYPRSAELWALLGLAFAKAGAKEEALNCNRKAVALDSRVGQYWYQLAVSYLSDSGGKANAAAREALEKTVEQRPADKLAWLLLAEQQVLGRNYPAAEKALIEVAKLEPDFAPAIFLLGYAKGQQGDYAAAEQAMLRCVQLDGKHTRARLYLALLYAKQKRYPQAAAAYEGIVSVDPNHPSAWRNLALLHRQLGREAAAVQAFQRHQKVGAAKR